MMQLAYYNITYSIYNKSKIFKMQTTIGDIMHHEQIKQLISKLVPIRFEDYASLTWFKQDEKLQKLNMQLHVNALMKNDEFILEEVVTQQKFHILIVDLIITSVWKRKILPLLVKDVASFNSLKIYLAVYHEAVVCNMLQVMFYYSTAIVQSKDYLIQVIDYCFQKITAQISKSLAKRKKERQSRGKKQQKQLTDQQKKKQKLNKILKKTPVQEFQSQIEQIQFSIFIMCVSILKYITDYIGKLQIGIVHHIIVQCNVFNLLVPLIEQKPWLRTNDKNERQIFQNNKWNFVPKSQYGRLPKSQGQVWLTLYNLFGNPQCMKKYQLNDERKNTLLRLRKYMNEVLLDQIPALAAMLRSLEHLSMTSVPANLSSNPFVVQQIPVISSQLQKIENWEQIAREHSQKLKKGLDEGERQHMRKLAQLYSNNNVQGLIEGFKCGKCEKQAFKRCSKCKSIWYCSRECQVSDWSNHKAACNQKVKQMKQNQSKKQQYVAPKPALIDQLD